MDSCTMIVMNVTELLKEQTLYYRSFVSRSIFFALSEQKQYLSYAEVYALAFNASEFILTISPQQIYAILNYKQAFNQMLELASSKKDIDEHDVLELVQLLYKDANIEVTYRNTQAKLAFKEVLDTFHHSKVRVIKRQYKQAASLYLVMRTIEPFTQGNVCISALLLNYMLLKWQLTPHLFLKDDASYVTSCINKPNASGFATYLQETAIQERQIIDKCIVRE